MIESQGRTFKAMIQEFVLQSTYLNEDLIPAYNSDKGQQIYKETMEVVGQKFPHYVQELQGISDGSEVPFFKVCQTSSSGRQIQFNCDFVFRSGQLMLLHIDAGIIVNEPGMAEDKPSVQSGNGCSSIICNREDVIMTIDYYLSYVG